jgi:Terminase large subunit, T4likevirus-type, N-terminal
VYSATAQPELTRREIVTQVIMCQESCIYWIWNYVTIKPDKDDAYAPFHPWPAQQEVLDGLCNNKLVVLGKARQLGQTTLVLAFALWVALFRKNQTILLFSKDLKTAKDLIKRLRMMFYQLPRWMRPKVVTDNCDTIVFANGSRFISFASKASQGDSFTAQLAIIDECDLIDDLDTLLGGVKPTIAASGQLILLSRPNKSTPESTFKKIFKAALAGENNYWAKFLSWKARPDRNQEFYDKEYADAQSPDWMAEQYPNSITEFLAPRSEDKRIPRKWLEACSPPLDENGVRQWPAPIENPAILAGVPGLRLFEEPIIGRRYVIGVDLASGRGHNPNLDDSAAIIMDKLTCRQVGILVDRVEPALFAEYTATLSRHFNKAGVLPELNGRWGGMFFQHLKDKCQDIEILRGPDGDEGFNTTATSKNDLYQRLAESARCGGMTINDEQTYNQLASIEARTLEAPEGLHDDCSMAYGFAIWACENPGPTPFVVVAGPPEMPKHDRPVDTSWSALGALGVKKPLR